MFNAVLPRPPNPVYVESEEQRRRERASKTDHVKMVPDHSKQVLPFNLIDCNVFFRRSAARNGSALQDHEKNDLDPDHDHLTKSDLRSRSDPDLT